MHVFMSLIEAIVIYVISFKHEYTKEEFNKTIPFVIILLGLMILLGL